MKQPHISYPTLPGEMLREEFLTPMKLSQSQLAREINVAPRKINEICNGKRAISSKTALLLAGYFDTTPELWMNLQMAWDLWKEWEKYKEAS